MQLRKHFQTNFRCLAESNIVRTLHCRNFLKGRGRIAVGVWCKTKLHTCREEHNAVVVVETVNAVERV